MSKLVALFVFVLALSGVCQNSNEGNSPSEKFTIESPGRDVRDAIHSLFTQAKRNYILDPKVHYTLYLSVRDIDFERGLTLLMDQAKLQYEIRDGIYYVGPSSVTVASPPSRPAPKVEVDWHTLLAKKVTLKRQRTALRAIAASVTKLSGVPIEVDTSVPSYSLNVSFEGVTLKYALENITRAAKLTFEMGSDGVIRILQTGTGESSMVEETHKANVKPAASLKCPSCSGALNAGWKYCPYCGYWVKPITTKK